MVRIASITAGKVKLRRAKIEAQRKPNKEQKEASW